MPKPSNSLQTSVYRPRFFATSEVKAEFWAVAKSCCQLLKASCTAKLDWFDDGLNGFCAPYAKASRVLPLGSSRTTLLLPW